MLANSLIIGLISYTVSVIYNLIKARSLEVVFYTGLDFLIWISFMALFLQLSYYLIKDFSREKDKKILTENDEEKTKTVNDEAAGIDSGNMNDEFSESAIENDFETEEFSALDSENFEIEQNNE